MTLLFHYEPVKPNIIGHPGFNLAMATRRGFDLNDFD
jgi:hypothetical protein